MASLLRLQLCQQLRRLRGSLLFSLGERRLEVRLKLLGREGDLPPQPDDLTSLSCGGGAAMAWPIWRGRYDRWLLVTRGVEVWWALAG